MHASSLTGRSQGDFEHTFVTLANKMAHRRALARLMMTSMTTRELAGQRRRYCSPALLPNNVHASITEKAGRPGHPGERGTRAHALALPDRDPGPGAERAPRVGYPRDAAPYVRPASCRAHAHACGRRPGGKCSACTQQN